MNPRPHDPATGHKPRQAPGAPEPHGHRSTAGPLQGRGPAAPRTMPGGAGSALLLALSLSFHLSPAAPDQCSKGSNVFTELPENSANGTAVATLALPAAGSIKLCLSGTDATWFYLDGRTVRLQAAPGAPLDREALESPVLMVALTCSEDGFSPVEYRLVVQVLNENDNRPRFQPSPELTHNVSELAAVNSVVFTAQAEDGDGDTLVYVIDGASADAKHFRIDLPNSGRIVLAKALDFETRRELDFVVHAVEMNTKERYKASAHIHVSVLDGDDQYPQFLPCRALHPAAASVCLSPIYTANITAGRAQVRPLHFLPGAIHAEDGDHSLKAAITYSLLPGPYSGWFHVNNATGAVTLLRPLDGPGLPPAVTLQVMAAQVNDATKFAVAEAQVRVLAPNRHPPRFARPHYPAFVRQGPQAATLAATYGGHVLALHAADRDFPDGFNPWIRYRLALPANASELFQLMPNGLLVARADQLQAAQHFLLQVIARDEESGEVTNATVDIEVLRPGQAAPQDPVEAGQEQSPPDVAVIVGTLGGLLLLLGLLLGLVICAVRRCPDEDESLDRTSLTVEKHPNVSLKWFKTATPTKTAPGSGSLFFENEGYSDLGDEAPGGSGEPAPQAHPGGRSEPAEPGKQSGTGSAGGGQPVPSATVPSKEGCAQGALANGTTLEQTGHKEGVEPEPEPGPEPTEESGAAGSPEPGPGRPAPSKAEASESPAEPGAQAPELPPGAAERGPGDTDTPGRDPETAAKLPALPALPEVNEESLEEEAARPPTPRGPWPPTPPPLGKPHMPAPFARLLEDSIEC